MANQAIFRSEAGSNRGLDVTLAFDWSPGDISRENSQITGGVRYNGAIPDRPHDTAAFGFVDTKIGDLFRSIDIPLGAGIGESNRTEPCGLLEALPDVPACVSVLLGCRRELARAGRRRDGIWRNNRFLEFV